MDNVTLVLIIVAVALLLIIFRFRQRVSVSLEAFGVKFKAKGEAAPPAMNGGKARLLEAETVPQALPGLISARPEQLPSDLADFEGRSTEVDELLALFEEKGQHATITAIGGMAGVGKSALAVHVAHRLAERYPDGQLFVELGGTSERPLTPGQAMARVIHGFEPAARLPDEPDEVAAVYRGILGKQHALIVLDNAANAAQVRPLLPPAPSAAIVTSRRTIALAELRAINLDALGEPEARRLLQGILGPGRASEAELAEIVGLCGRLPLALRVAGTFLVAQRDWTTREYVGALSDERQRLRRLRMEDDPALDVAASLGMSAAQLAGEDAELAARWGMLAVFPESFERLAAAAVWEDPAEPARDALSALLTRSMVLYDQDRARYRLHDLMRDVARGAYADAADPVTTAEQEQRTLAAEARHAAHYRGVLARANELYLQGGDAIAAGLALFDLEQHDIEAGQAWAAERVEEDDDAARLCSSYPDAGAHVLNLRQAPWARIAWLEAAAGAARRTGDRRLEGTALGNLGNAYAELGETGRAIEYHKQALKIVRETGDRRVEGGVLGNLGNAYAALGETRRAIEYYEQHLKIAREIGDRRGEGAALGNLGVAYKNLGETRRAIEYHEQRLEIARQIGDRRGEGGALGDLGVAYANLGETRRAIDYYEQRLKIAHEVGDRHGEGQTLCNLGIAYKNLGETRRAIEYHEQDLKIAREIGDRRGEGGALGNLGVAYADLGDTRRAIEYYEQHLKIAREIGDRRGEGNALGNLGIAYADLGDTRRAIEYYEQRLEIARQIGDRRAEGNALFHSAEALYKMGKRREAVERMETAAKIYEEIESPHAARARSTLAKWRTET